jgi:ABC-2 type transport system ATP-binding protein
MGQSQNEWAITTDGLTRTYKTYEKKEGIIESIKGLWERKYTEKIALAPTTLQIEKGQIIGLVGANGAGKTTLLKLLSGLIYPSGGSAQVLGFEPWKREPAFLRRMSILLGQKNQLWWDIAPADSYQLLAEIYNLDKSHAQKRALELAEMLDCRHVLNTQLRRLSLGERMKMEIIGALLHSPDIMFLDEPTIGLDIVAQTKIRKFIGEYVKEKGPTIILTSHYMDDIAQLADRLLLISKGQIVYSGTVDEFTGTQELVQKISFALNQPLTQKVELPNGMTLQSGQEIFNIEVKTNDVPQVLGEVAHLPGIHNLKFEEADFEDIIHRFLEKESRVLSPGHHHQP